LADTCNKLHLQRKTGIDHWNLVSKVESDIKQVQTVSQEISTKYVHMGGANNLGMLLHYSSQSQTPFYTTKLESCHLANRELAFLQWQKNSLDKSETIAPMLICCYPVAGSKICALTMEYLSQPKEYKPKAIIELYQRMGQLTTKLSRIKGVEDRDGLFQFELEAKTKITRTINYIVTKMHLPEAYEQAQFFMKKRQNAFVSRPVEFVQIMQFILNSSFLVKDFDFEKHYGLLHGDFKKANILMDSSGQLRVIDLQYYNYGARLWDLAFFCSKEKSWYGETYNKFIRPLELDESESRIFTMLYTLAILLHVKKSNVKKKLYMHVMPAISMVNSL